jgi:hypothetical protein
MGTFALPANMHSLAIKKVIRKMVTINTVTIVRRGCLVHGRVPYAYKNATGVQKSVHINQYAEPMVAV